MENNPEDKSNEKTITVDQAIEAMRYVRSYIKLNGGDPYDVDWFGKKPSHLPEDVSRAWDTVVAQADQEAGKGYTS